MDSIGIGAGVHVTSFDPNSDDSKWDSLMVPRLKELGVRFVRSDLDTHNVESERRIKQLGAMGIVTQGLFDPRKPEWNTAHTPEQVVAMLKRVGPRNMIVEGPNEPDNVNPGYRFEYRGQQMPDQPLGLRDYMRDVYTALKADPETKNVPVVQSSSGRPYGDDFMRYADYVNAHFYGPGTAPGWGVNWEGFRKLWGDKPLVVTETGDHTSVYHTDALWQRGVPEDVQAKNLARVPFYYFAHGVVRTFIYRLTDGPDPFNSQASFGLLRFGGQPKPAFSALGSLIALLRDPGPAFSPQPLDVELGGDAKSVMSVLLEKRDGRYELALWQNVDSLDPQSGTALKIGPATVSIEVKGAFAGANLFQPVTNGAACIGVQRGTTYTVRVPDHPLLVEIVPRAAMLATQVVPASDVVPNVLPPVKPKGLVTAQASGGNLIANFGFETGTLNPWLDFGTHSVVVRGPNVKSGGYAARIGGNDGKGGLNLAVGNLEPNTTYVLQCDARLALPNQTARLTASSYGGQDATRLFSQTDYAPVSVQFTTGPDEHSAQISLWKDGGKGYAYADNFILCKPEQLERVRTFIASGAANNIAPAGPDVVTEGAP